MTSNASIADTPRPKRKRPFGVNAIIVLSTLIVVYSVVVAAGLYVGIASEIPILASLQVERWLMIYLIGTAVVQVFIIVGLWRLKRWGWFLVMLNTGVGMVLNIWAYFNARPNYVAMAISVLIVLYLNQREVQLAFVEPEEAGQPLERSSA